MGARGAGHIADLCAVARPAVGVVTRVAAVHTETFGTVDDVAVAKGELVAALPASGVAVLNAADPRVAAMARPHRGAGPALRGGRRRARRGRRARRRAAADVPGRDALGRAEVRFGVRGVHMVDNALAATAAALVCDVPLDGVVAGARHRRRRRWRMELSTLPNGARLLNDAYNANPASMAAALGALAAIDAARHVAVLGLMAELGPSSDNEHRAVGDLARELGVEVVAVAAPAYGGTPVPDLAGAVAALGDLGPDDAVLLKGSRVAGLERLVGLLR